MRPTVHVFVSSTWLDLQPERHQIERVLAGFRETKFNGMEHFGSDDTTPRERSLAEVDRSDLYVGILGGRYGSGITHDEYRRAQERRLHCLLYLKDDAAIAGDARDPEPDRRDALQTLKEEVHSRHLVRAHFATPEQLAAQVAIDLHRWLADALRPAVLSVYPRLTDALHDFKPLIEHETQAFVGRDEVFDAVQALPARHACGYLGIVADAGLGKTALAAAVAARLDAPAFFCNAAENLTRPHQGLEHLCAELILRYDLPHDHLPARAGEDSGHFGKLLAEAAQKAEAARLPLWLVIDGLDEADDPAPGRNPLLLPMRLPRNAFVLTTQRATPAKLLVQPGTALKELVLRADQPMQRRDVAAYLRVQAQQPAIAAARRAARPPLSSDAFVRLLADAADGNFKYLDYVLADIVESEPGHGPLQPAQLPAGLDRYYEQFWSRMGLDRAATDAWSDWQRLWRPVLSLLGAAAEPVDAGWLAHHAGCPPDEVLARVLKPWRRFLAVGGPAGAETWRVVHKSFADFLQRRPELDLPGTHRALAAAYLDRDDGPPAHSGYRQRHLAGHLARGGRLDDLFALIARRDWFDGQLAADPSGSLFLDDVRQAWAVTEAAAEAADGTPDLAREVQCAVTEATLRSLSSNLSPGLVAALVRYGDWSAGVALAAARQMPDGDQALQTLAALAADTADATVVRDALAAAHPLASSSWRRGQALAPFAAALARLGHVEEALATAGDAGAPADQAHALATVAPHLDAVGLATALERAFELAGAEIGHRDAEARRGRGRVIGNDWHVEALAALLRHVAPDDAPALRARCDALFAGESARSKLLHALVTAMAASGDTPLALRWAGEIGNEGERSASLADLIERLPAAQRADAARAGVAAVLPTGKRRILLPDDMTVLAKLLPHLPAGERGQALAGALWSTVRSLQPGEALALLAPALCDEAELGRAVEVANALDRDHQRQQALAGLAACALRLQGPDIALRMATAGLDSYNASEAMVDLVPQLAQAGFAQEALQAVRRIGREGFVPAALVALVPHLPAEVIDDALTFADGLTERQAWRRVVGALAERLAVLGRTPRALALLRTIRDGRTEGWRLQGSVAWLQARAGDGPSAMACVQAIDDGHWRASALSSVAPMLPADQQVTAWTAAVRLLNASHGKNAWGEPTWELDAERAVLALLPGLVAAVTSAQAVTLVRQIEPLRVRAQCMPLAAAAADAERDGHQQEAVAVLASQIEDQPYAALPALGDVAPHLGLPALRDALAAVARERRRWLRRQGSGADDALLWAETALLRRLADLEPEGMGPTVERVRRLAAGLRRREAAGLLGTLAVHLPLPVRALLLDDALQAFDDPSFHHLRMQTLVRLAPSLTADHAGRALALARELREPDECRQAVQAVVGRMADFEPVAGLLARVLASDDPTARAGALAALASRLSGDALAQAAAQVVRLPAQAWSEPAFAAVAARLAECGQADAAINVADQARSHAAPAFASIARWLDASAVARARERLHGQYRSQPEQAEIALAEHQVTLGEAVEGFERIDALGDDARCEGLRRAVAALAGADPSLLRRLWQRGLRAAAGRPRDQALREVHEWLPVAAALGGVGQLGALADSARRVLGTWP